MAWRLAIVFVGGGAGSVLRYALAGATQKLAGAGFPWGTLAVNLAGCAAIGLLFALFTGPVLVREEWRLALLVGLLGGFTTFSTFSLETVSLLNAGQVGLALANLVLSNGVGLAATWLGLRLLTVLRGP